MVVHSHGKRNGLRAKMRRKVIREWLKEYDEKHRFTLDTPIKRLKHMKSLEETLKEFNLKYLPKHGGGGNHSSNVMRIKTDNFCAVCGEDLKINHKIIHHISYPPDTITISLCCKCHGMVHSGCYVKPSLLDRKSVV